MSTDVSPARAWILACRPATLTAALAPVAVGTAVAYREGGFRLAPALAALFGAFAIQIGTNLANDVFDAKKGADTAERLGPVRAVAAGLLSARAVGVGMIIAFGFATLAGLYLVQQGGWPIVLIGVLSIVSGILYTAGPWALAYVGLGDVFVMIFFGLVAVLGTAYVQTKTWSPLGVWVAVPVGALATAVLVVNNLRDRETDLKANKRTLVVRFGRRFGLVEYATLLALAYLVPPLLVVFGFAQPWVLLTFATLPRALGLYREVKAGEGRALNPLLGKTAQLLLFYALLLALGLCT
ncbi:MAG: 1,4-dihydroxy-2-naphthoate polyprenyltransferase [Deltaproteobacteria bacterium]|jgi:1,4-dihydroxy-2-naphthoate octaprenyltransferase|nr:1,4-dihydroxy-2-naphthoate polyprenyltransferase [Deltaproteobacteria bacterium]